MSYLARRGALFVLTLFLISIVTFAITHVLPGDVAMMIMGTQSNPVALAGLRDSLGLDDPLIEQYGRWIGGIVLRGTLGESLLGGWRIEERMLGRLPVTAELGLLAILIGLVIALPVGIYSAVRQYTAADYVGGRSPSWGWRRPTSGWERW